MNRVATVTPRAPQGGKNLLRDQIHAQFKINGYEDTNSGPLEFSFYRV